VAFQERHGTPSFESLARELLVVGHAGRFAGLGDFEISSAYGPPKFCPISKSMPCSGDQNGSKFKTNLGIVCKDHNIALDK
jgi:hypothetical protein